MLVKPLVETQPIEIEQVDTSGIEDAGWIGRVLAGDTESFGMLVNKYYTRIYNFIRTMIRSEDDSLDMTQESFVKAFKNLATLKTPERFKSWLFRIASNTTLDFVRKRRLNTIDAENSLKEQYIETDNPEHEIVMANRTNVIREALAKLKPDQREILVLCDLEGMSYQDISEILNIPFGTVQSRIFYARKRLKEFLDPVTINHTRSLSQ